MQVYGQSDPPKYKVEDVKVPVATYWGENDYLASREVGIYRVIQASCEMPKFEINDY